MEWDIVFSKSEYKWGTFMFILFCISCGYVFGKLFTCRIYFVYHRRLNFEILLCTKIIHTLFLDVSPLLFFGIESLFHPKTVCHIKNGISYSWRMKISSSSWTTTFRYISCNNLWKFSGSLKKAAKCMNWFINQEKTKYMPVT